MKHKCTRKDKCISGILCARKGSITDKEFLKLDRIDDVVNAANPTLMGSGQGVDGSVHQLIDRNIPLTKEAECWTDCLFTYGNTGIKFFFIKTVFGYLAGYMKQRKFLA